MDEANLFRLAEWNHRRTLFSHKKREEAARDLEKCGHSREYLKAQWIAQVKAQTKPVPSKPLVLWTDLQVGLIFG